MSNSDSKQQDSLQMFLLDSNSITDASVDEIQMMLNATDIAQRSALFYMDKKEILKLQKYAQFVPLRLSGDKPEFAETHVKFIEQSARGLANNLPDSWAMSEVVLTDACIYRNQIHFPQHDWAMLHELNRPHERKVPLKHSDFVNVQLGSQVIQSGDIPTLFVTCEGSHNWGHFLMEDLPRIVNFIQRQSSSEIHIIMTSFFAESAVIDKRKEQLVRGLFPHRHITFTFAKREIPLQIDKVTYLTPIALHPVFHSPELVQSVIQQFTRHHAASLSPTKRLLVLRKGSRKIESDIENILIEMLLPHGFEVVYPEEMNGLDQALLFASATHIIGVMGAAMTNVIFAPKETKVIYLSPVDWKELFYWDISCIRGDTYFAYYGQSVADDSLDFVSRNFRFDISQLRRFLKEILFND